MGADRVKAELLAEGRVLLPRGMRLPVHLSRSSAGPGAGAFSLFIELGRSGGSVVRLEAVREGRVGVFSEPPLRMEEAEGSAGQYRILRGEEALAENVVPLSGELHAPRQAFVNLRDSCKYRCAFCALPRLPPRPRPSLRRWKELVVGAVAEGRVDAVAVTSGVPRSPAESVRELARFVRGVRRALPAVPIGVEPYATSREMIRALKEAGASELKLNVQCATERIFRRICPGLDWSGIWNALEHGVGIFGASRVCSNLILGLGESDEEALSASERLAMMGVLANLRPLSINPLNYGPLRLAMGRAPRPNSASRLLRLSKAYKRILERHSLDPREFRTMCHRCTACELAPFKDL